MAEAASKLPIKQERTAPAAQRTPSPWQPFDTLREEMDRIFDEFTRGFGPFPLGRRVFDVEPLWRRETSVDVSPR